MRSLRLKRKRIGLTAALFVGLTLIFFGFMSLGASLGGTGFGFDVQPGDSYMVQDSGAAAPVSMAWSPLAIIGGVILLMIGGFGMVDDIRRERKRSDLRGVVHQYYNYERQKFRRYPPNT